MTVPNKAALAVGVINASIGAAILTVGVIRSGPATADATPGWVVALTGLLFVFGGAAIVMKTLAGGSDSNGEMPPDAPRALRMAYDVLVSAIALSLPSIFSWVAVGPGERQFSVSAGAGGAAIALGTSPADQMTGRIAFGIGSAVAWLIGGAIVLYIWRRWFPRRVEPGRAIE
jgi:hypothetical protein